MGKIETRIAKYLRKKGIKIVQYGEDRELIDKFDTCQMPSFAKNRANLDLIANRIKSMAGPREVSLSVKTILVRKKGDVKRTQRLIIRAGVYK